MSDSGSLHGVLVTFRRPRELSLSLQRLAGQTRRLDRLVVVDNDDDPQAKAVVEAAVDVAGTVEYVAASENLGPAGGLALGISTVLRTADKADWVTFFDDDNPPRMADMLAEIASFAVEMQRQDSNTAAVGLAGARFDARTGLLVRLADHELRGPVLVDYIGGGNLPCYRVAVMRKVGLPDPRLFFGYDDLEYGLQLRAAGWRLYVDGEAWTRERRVWGRIGVHRSPSRELQPPGWRDYYRTRNIIWILRRDGHHLAVARFMGRRLAKAAYNAPRRPKAAWRHLSLGLRAAFDGYVGRMGRRVDPPIPRPGRTDGAASSP